MKTQIVKITMIVLLSLTLPLSAFSNQVKKVKGDRAMIQFSNVDLRSGDTVEFTNASGEVVGKGKVTAIRKNQAIVRLSSGEDQVKPGQGVRLPPAPFEVSDSEEMSDDESSDDEKKPAYRQSSKTYLNRGFHLGLHVGYALPQITGAENALSYGVLLGYRVSEKFDLALNISTFAYTPVRFIFPFLQASFAPFGTLPLFFGAGVGGALVSAGAFSATDFGPKIFGTYEINLSPSMSIAPEASLYYILPVAATTVESYSIIEIAARFRYYF